jgi:hypothetical protein
MVYQTSPSSLYVTGLSHAYPQHSYGPKDFDDLVKRLYPEYATSPGYVHVSQLPLATADHAIAAASKN